MAVPGQRPQESTGRGGGRTGTGGERGAKLTAQILAGSSLRSPGIPTPLLITRDYFESLPSRGRRDAGEESREGRQVRRKTCREELGEDAPGLLHFPEFRAATPTRSRAPQEKRRRVIG